MDTVSVDAYVLEVLMPDLVGHDHRPSAFLVLLHLWRKTRGGRVQVTASLQMIAESTGLSKRAAQTAITHLEGRRLISVRRKTATSAPAFTLRCDWRGR